MTIESSPLLIDEFVVITIKVNNSNNNNNSVQNSILSNFILLNNTIISIQAGEKVRST